MIQGPVEFEIKIMEVDPATHESGGQSNDEIGDFNVTIPSKYAPFSLTPDWTTHVFENAAARYGHLHLT